MTISSNYFVHVFKKWARDRYFLRKLVIKLHLWLQKVFTSEILPVVFFNIKIATNHVDVINYPHVKNISSNSMNQELITGKRNFSF